MSVPSVSRSTTLGPDQDTQQSADWAEMGVQQHPYGKSRLAEFALKGGRRGRMFGLLEIGSDDPRVVTAIHERLSPQVEALEVIGPAHAALVVADSRTANGLARSLLEPLFSRGKETTVVARVGLAPIQVGAGLDGIALEELAWHALSNARANQRVLGFITDEDAGPGDWELTLGIGRAFEDGELSLYFQPQVSASGEVLGYEGLMRWHNVAWGAIPPSRFLPIVEQTRNMQRLTALSLQSALKFSDKTGKPVAVNLSPEQVLSPNFVTTLEYVLHAYGTTDAKLELEITENALVSSMQAMSDTVAQVRALGVRVAIDDFGSGYSNLMLLPGVEVDKLKLDKSLVDNIVGNTRNRAVCRSLAELGHELGMCVVAEGVETLEQLVVLQEIGFDAFQGFFFDPALDASVARERAVMGYKGLLLAA